MADETGDPAKEPTALPESGGTESGSLPPRYIPEHEWALGWARRHPTATRLSALALLIALALGVATWWVSRHSSVAARDREPPWVVRVRSPVSPLEVVISFSEPVRAETAENPQAYEIGGVNPVSATLDGPATNVLLRLDIPLQFANTVTLTLQGISDQAPKPNVMARTNIVLRTPTLTRGILRADYFLNMKWHTVEALTGNPAFPSLYDLTVYRTNSTAPRNVGDNYGLRLWGFFIPPTNGSYTFYVRSDDESEVYLSPDVNPENKTLVASQTGSGRPYDSADGQPRFSTVTNLVAGQLYYLEALLKEGGGEDYLTLVYKAENEPPPTHRTQSVTPIPASALACYADSNGVTTTTLLQLPSSDAQLPGP